jgi:hypothetical protein
MPPVKGDSEIWVEYNNVSRDFQDETIIMGIAFLDFSPLIV